MSDQANRPWYDAASFFDDAELYGELCDVVERTCQGWPLDGPDHDGNSYTSNRARTAANRIHEIIDAYFQRPRPLFSIDASVHAGSSARRPTGGRSCRYGQASE